MGKKCIFFIVMTKNIKNFIHFYAMIMLIFKKDKRGHYEEIKIWYNRRGRNCG